MHRLVMLIVLGLVSLAACDIHPHAVIPEDPNVECGAFEGPDCNDLLEIGQDAIAGARQDRPLAIGVDNACPPNARCVPSSLGGATAAVVIRWPDGTIQWATIPLPPDWPASPPGQATVMTETPPEHILLLVGAGETIS